MDIKQTGNKIFLIILILLGILFLILLPSQIRQPGFATTTGALSAQFFPRVLLISLIVCCSLVLLFDWLHHRRTNPRAEQRSNGFEDVNVARVGMGMGLLISYALLFNVLGFLGSTILHLSLLLRCFEVKKLKVLVPVVLFFTLLLYYVFKVALKIPLPPFSLFE